MPAREVCRTLALVLVFDIICQTRASSASIRTFACCISPFGRPAGFAHRRSRPAGPVRTHPLHCRVDQSDGIGRRCVRGSWVHSGWSNQACSVLHVAVAVGERADVRARMNRLGVCISVQWSPRLNDPVRLRRPVVSPWSRAAQAGHVPLRQPMVR